MLIRTISIKFLIRDSGPINEWLLHFGVIDTPITLINTDFAVQLGLFCSYLPLMAPGILSGLLLAFIISLVVLLKDAPNRGNVLLFMDFLLQPENIAVVSNFAQYTAGVKGVTPLLDEALKTSMEQNPPTSRPRFSTVAFGLALSSSADPFRGAGAPRNTSHSKIGGYSESHVCWPSDLRVADD